MSIKSLNGFMQRPHAWLWETIVESPLRTLCSAALTCKKPKVKFLDTYQFLQEIPRHKTYVLDLRHGEAEANALKLVGGSSKLADRKLTKKGEEEARQLGKALAPFKGRIRTVYASPLERARQTAEIALEAMGCAKDVRLQVDDRITEKFFGKDIDGHSEENYKQYSAKEKAETQKMNFSQKWNYVVVQDSESFKQIYDRVESFMLDAAKAHPGEVILVFGHKVSSIKIPAMAALKEIGVEVDYRDPLFEPKNGASAVFEVDATHRKIHLVAINGFSFSFLARQ
jgi:broad specificity phosphatase PhoE